MTELAPDSFTLFPLVRAMTLTEDNVIQVLELHICSVLCSTSK